MQRKIAIWHFDSVVVVKLLFAFLICNVIRLELLLVELL